MNKNTISWTHYIYATITATVLAYVTVMESSNDVNESATSMLPNIDNSDKTEEESESVEENEPESVEDNEPESVEDNELESVESLPVAVPIESSKETEPIRKSIFGSSKKKLKNNKTRTKTKYSKNTKTRRH